MMGQVVLSDPELDVRDPFTRWVLLAEYWQREAKKARAEVEELRLLAKINDNSGSLNLGN